MSTGGIVALGVVGVGALGVGAYFLFAHKAAPVSAPTQQPPAQNHIPTVPGNAGNLGNDIANFDIGAAIKTVSGAINIGQDIGNFFNGL